MKSALLSWTPESRHPRLRAPPRAPARIRLRRCTTTPGTRPGTDGRTSLAARRTLPIRTKPMIRIPPGAAPEPQREPSLEPGTQGVPCGTLYGVRCGGRLTRSGKPGWLPPGPPPAPPDPASRLRECPQLPRHLTPQHGPTARVADEGRPPSPRPPRATLGHPNTRPRTRSDVRAADNGRWGG